MLKAAVVAVKFCRYHCCVVAGLGALCGLHDVSVAVVVGAACLCC